MDEDAMRLDLAEGIGKATAAICIQSALVGSLISKGVLTVEDAATLTGAASERLSRMEGLPEDARVIAEAALRGIATTWTKLVTKN